MPAPLRIGEAAQRLGVTTDTLREWVRRGHLEGTLTPTGQLVFEAEDVEAVRRGAPRDTRTPSSAPTPPARPVERPRQPTWKELPPWQMQVEAARAAIATDELEDERERKALQREAERRDHAQSERTRARIAAQHQRLERQKLRVFQTVFIESEHRAPVAAAIEAFVTRAHVPDWLSDVEQYELIADKVRSVLDALRDAAREREAARLEAAAERVRLAAETVTASWYALLPPVSSAQPAAPAAPRTVAAARRRRRGMA